MMSFTEEDVQQIVAEAVEVVLQAVPKQQPAASAHLIMDHIHSRIPKFSFKPEHGPTFEKRYDRYSPIIESEGGALAKGDKIHFIPTKLNASEYDTFVN